LSIGYLLHENRQRQEWPTDNHAFDKLHYMRLMHTIAIVVMTLCKRGWTIS